MPFDGRNYNGAPLIAPLKSHPDANSTGACFSRSTQIGYFYSRRAARLFGVQTYRHSLDRPELERQITGLIVSSLFVDLQESERYVPEHFTHLNYEAHFRAYPAGPARASHRLRVDNGGSTLSDVIEIECQPFQGAFQPGAGFPAGASARTLNAQPYDPSTNPLYVVRGTAEISSLVSGGADLVAKVEGKLTLVDDDSPQPYAPEFYLMWLESID